MLFDTKARPPVHAAASRAFPEPLRRGTGHDIFRPPAIRFSVIRYPPRSWALLTVGLPGTPCCPDPDGVTAFHTHELRPGWVPPIPRGRRCSPDRPLISGQRLPLLNGQSLHPATTSIERGLR